MDIYKYKLEFMEEVYFSSQEIDRLFMSKPFIGNYALAYALGAVKSKYDQTYISYQEDFKILNKRNFYITPAQIIGKPLYSFCTFNALSDTYNNKMTRAESNYPQTGKIKLLSIGNKAEGLIFCNDEKTLKSYIRLGKFMGKVKVTYEKCSYKKIEAEKDCFGLINSADLSQEFQLKNFSLMNVYPVPLYKQANGCGRMFEIKTEPGTIYYPCKVSFGGKDENN